MKTQRKLNGCTTSFKARKKKSFAFSRMSTSNFRKTLSLMRETWPLYICLQCPWLHPIRSSCLFVILRVSTSQCLSQFWLNLTRQLRKSIKFLNTNCTASSITYPHIGFCTFILSMLISKAWTLVKIYPLRLLSTIWKWTAAIISNAHSTTQLVTSMIFAKHSWRRM